MSLLKDRYIEWLCDTVCQNNRFVNPTMYTRLFTKLYDTQFTYILPLDGNRAADGALLRYRFGSIHEVPESVISTELDSQKCSVLEMMVALASRCEDQIMSDESLGDRTHVWFWTMVENLGLLAMDDSHFSDEIVDESLYIFLNRKYSPNGDGGLFYVKHPKKDLTKVEIWYQMYWYLNEIDD